MSTITGSSKTIAIPTDRAEVSCAVDRVSDVDRSDSLSPARSKALCALIWTLIMLAGLETAVRVRAVSRYGWRQGLSGWISADAATGSVNQPGMVTTPNGAVCTINQWGLRGRDFALQKPADTYRILCLGESTTFGQPGDDDEAIWPARLEERLSSIGDAVEVINGAAPGHTTDHTRQKLERLLGFDPDMIIIYHAATDIAAHSKRQFAAETERVSVEAELSAIRDRVSMGYMLMRRNTAAWLTTQYQNHRDARLDERGIDRFRDSVSSMVRHCLSRNVDVVLCTFPRAFDKFQPSGEQIKAAETALFFNPHLDVSGLNDAYERYNDAIRSSARKANVEFIDLDSAITADQDCFIDSVHLSTVGHDRAAARIADVIENRVSRRALAGAVQ